MDAQAEIIKYENSELSPLAAEKSKLKTSNKEASFT